VHDAARPERDRGALPRRRPRSASARRRRHRPHPDAAQAIGKIPVSVDDPRVDLLSIAGHKVYAPKGVGALYVRRETALAPVLAGAGQERGLRPGTENVAGIVGLGAACELAHAHLAPELGRLGALREGLFATLVAAVPGLVCHTPLDASLPNTLFVSFPGVRGADLLARAPGVAASTGSACHAGEETPSTTLVARGAAPEVTSSAVRLSLGRDTTGASVALAADRLVAAWCQAPKEHSVPEVLKRPETLKRQE
jgi:cysteine desulfurase